MNVYYYLNIKHVKQVCEFLIQPVKSNLISAMIEMRVETINVS